MKLKASSARRVFGLSLTLSLLCAMAAPISAISESTIPPAEEVISSEDAGDQSTVLLDTDIRGKQRPVSSSVGSRAADKNRNGDLATVKYKQGVPCTPMMLVDDPNTLIVCDRDSVIRADKRTITLTRGKGVYMVGKQPLVVETQLGSVTLPGNSAAIIEQSENGLLRVDHLTGACSSVSVKRWKGTKSYDASFGDEICLAPKGSSPKLLVPSDGIDRQEVSSEIGDAGIMLAENKFAPKSMLEKECLLQCDSNSFFQVRRKVYNLRRSIDEQDENVGTSPCKTEEIHMPLMFLTGEDQSTQMKPVTLAEPANVQLAMHSKRSRSALLKYNDRTEIDFDHPSVTVLKNGEAVVSTSELTYIKTPHSMLKIQPGSVVLIGVDDGVTKVRTLWENQRNSVCQTVSDKPFYVVAGDESLASNELRSIYLAAAKDMVGRRLNHYSEIGDGKVIHFSEISLMSLAQSSDLLSQLMNSTNVDDQTIIKKLNKMAAILVQISASHGMYELMQPPQWKHDAKASSLSVVY